jgi:proline iminopeptidase
VAENRTADLVEDLERIRCELGVSRWLIFGGSWGATLALVYTQAHPGAVTGLVLRGCFLARERDLRWFFGPDGVARLFPEAWEAFAKAIPHAESEDLVEAYYQRVQSPDSEMAGCFAQAWCTWEDRVATWNLAHGAANGPEGPARGGTRVEVSDRLLAKARIATHYARHGYFIAPNAILDRVRDLPAVPVTFVQGERDLVCPLEGAWALHRAVPSSRLLVVRSAGHLASEPGMIDALIRETDRLRHHLA